MISLSSKTTEESLLLVTKIDWPGYTVPLFRGVHWQPKNALNLLQVCHQLEEVVYWVFFCYEKLFLV